MRVETAGNTDWLPMGMVEVDGREIDHASLHCTANRTQGGEPKLRKEWIGMEVRVLSL
jgi:hypothetical protein